MLSEAAVLGFEYGMSSADPRRLVLWEAQFGDFANGAQVIIDQFVASAESKWQRMSGSGDAAAARLRGPGPRAFERAPRALPAALRPTSNMQVVNLTTPAQLFHALRRQIHRPFRKPLDRHEPEEPAPSASARSRRSTISRTARSTP